MGDRPQEIRTLWNYQDLTQPISLGRAFEDVEWCLGEIGRLTRERDEISNDLRLAAGELLVSLPEPGSDASRVLIANRLMRAERNAALKREGRLREALRKYGIHDTLCRYYYGEIGCDCGLAEALADEGRE